MIQAKRQIYGRTFWTVVACIWCLTLGVLVGFRAGKDVVKTGDPEMVKRAYAVGYCVKGNMEAAKDAGAPYEQLVEMLPKAQAWCAEQLAEFEVWVAEQEERNGDRIRD